MKLVVTGGGTGGHVFSALAVGLEAKAQGWDVAYYGSERGQERKNCEQAMMPFTAFPSAPVYKVYTLAGMKRLLGLLKATSLVLQTFRVKRPDVVFATGGYSAAPVLNAARKLGLNVVLHEQNSVPGRTNKLMAGHARAVCTAFRSTARHFPGDKVHRTGMPVRSAFRAGGQGSLMMDADAGPAVDRVLVMGGSQGSSALNDLALSTAVRMAASEVQWFHLTGLGHFESTLNSKERLAVASAYTVKAYLEAEEMASAMFNSTLAVCRSGAGTIAELAALRKPAIYVPYPHAFGQHQLFNAREIVELGGGDLVEEGSIQPSTLEARILAWVSDRDRIAAAERALAEWDIPDATGRILGILKEASV